MCLLLVILTAGEDSPLHQYVDNLADLAWNNPGQFLLVVGLLGGAAALLALQLWIIIIPIRHSTIKPLLLRQKEAEAEQVHHSLHHFETTTAAAGGVGWGYAATAAGGGVVGGDGTAGQGFRQQQQYQGYQQHFPGVGVPPWPMGGLGRGPGFRHGFEMQLVASKLRQGLGLGGGVWPLDWAQGQPLLLQQQQQEGLLQWGGETEFRGDGGISEDVGEEGMSGYQSESDEEGVPLLPPVNPNEEDLLAGGVGSRSSGEWQCGEYQEDWYGGGPDYQEQQQQQGEGVKPQEQERAQAEQQYGGNGGAVREGGCNQLSAVLVAAGGCDVPDDWEEVAVQGMVPGPFNTAAAAGGGGVAARGGGGVGGGRLGGFSHSEGSSSSCLMPPGMLEEEEESWEVGADREIWLVRGRAGGGGGGGIGQGWGIGRGRGIGQRLGIG